MLLHFYISLIVDFIVVLAYAVVFMIIDPIITIIAIIAIIIVIIFVIIVINLVYKCSETCETRLLLARDKS